MKGYILFLFQLVREFVRTVKKQNMDVYHKIRKGIETCLTKESGHKIILYPFGEQGLLTKQILNEVYGIEEAYIIDNGLSVYNSRIKPITFLKELNLTNYICLITSENPQCYEELRMNIRKYIPERHIVDIFPREDCCPNLNIINTKCGKYSYGPLCKHWLVKSVGSFCSFAEGTDVLENHATEYISTAPFIYRGSECNDTYAQPYKMHKNSVWYFEGVIPRGKTKNRKITIGHDVWLGRNVLITNGSNIGNGVIAGAGAVITKDVPDYAVVAGVPARVIRYRYTQDQITELNKIAWWDWPDDKIRKCYNDFFESVEVFIRKHKVGEQEKMKIIG